MNGIIYKATSKTSGKIYIGQTTTSLNNRISNHKHKALYNIDLKNHFHNAIRKYGIDDFIWEVIDTAQDYKTLNEKEQYWINYYDSINNGYNILKGGQDIQANTQKFLLACGSKYFYAYKVDGTFLGRFLNQREFAEKYNIANTHISDLLNEKYNSCNGIIAIKEEDFTEEKLKEKLKKARNTFHPFMAIKIDTQEQFGPFYSIKECQKYFNFKSNHIGEILNKQRKTQNGYTFRFIEENIQCIIMI